MTHPTHPKSCRAQSSAPPEAGEAGLGARRRLGKRVAAAKVRAGHAYVDTLIAARRRKHPDKRERLIIELRAEIAALKALIAPSDSL